MPGASFIRTISPKRAIGIDPKWFKAQVDRELAEVGKLATKEFQKPVRTWKTKPSFKTRILGAGTNAVFLDVFPEGEGALNFNRLDFGVPPHLIHARFAKALSFRKKYRSATLPGRLSSRTASSSGPRIFAKSVLHPGVEARLFSKQVYGIVNPEYRRRMKNIVERGLRRGA
jgi:hypothetical protein